MLYFLAAFLLSVLLTFIVRRAALRFDVIDRPDDDRHLHGRPVALLGGVSVFLSFWAVILFLVFFHPIRGIERIENFLFATLFSSVIILVVGVADEIRPMSAKLRLLLVALAVMASAFLVPWLTKITNPFGGYIELGNMLGSLLVFFWLIGTTYTVKILDGLDGLATGIVAIGAFVIVLLTSFTKFYQPNVGLVALVFLGVCLGFLAFNFYPAKIFLGESGSLFLGFMIGVLAIIGGGKLATALLVMAIPIFDLVRVIYIRLKRKQHPFVGDREHLHFRLIDRGFSQRQAVGILYFLAIFFGLSTLFLQSIQKLYALLVLVILMVLISHYVSRRTHK